MPGKPAPTLVTTDMVERMAPGSVIIDLAAAEGGNCALTDGTRVVEHAGVEVIGAPDLCSSVPGEASAFYARNVLELLGLVLRDGGVRIDTDDEIVAAVLLTRAGQVLHAATAELLEKEARL